MRLHCSTLIGHAASGSHAVRQHTLAARVASAPTCLRTQLSASSSASASTDEDSEQPKPRNRRIRLFKPADSSDAAAPASSSGGPARAAPVSEEFRRAFEDMGVRPVGVRKLSKGNMQQRLSSAADASDSDNGSSRQRRDFRTKSDSDDERRSDGDRSPPRSRYSGSSGRENASTGRKESGYRWEGRGRLTRDSPATAAENERQRRRWEEEAEERKRIEEEEERKRLIRKARSERIPEQPKKRQDPVVFQALKRAVEGEWDEKMTKEELRGARAAARKIARIGLYDRNKSLRAVRRKLIRNPKASEDPEAAALAANAARQIQEAAAKSIQPSKEEVYSAAAGVKRDFSRAEALPEGEWERLKAEFKANQTIIKIGRKGCTDALVDQIQARWRGKEVVKLVIHDDKSSRKMNLPRLNVLLKELEEKTGTGVLIDCQGSSIWLYRGVDWVPKPVPPPYKPPPQHELLTEQHTPRGTWKDIAGVSCYVVSSSDAAGLTSPPGSESNSVSGEMTVLLLPDQFPMADTPILMQLADRVASKGALVILADLLGPKASLPQSSVATKGAATAGATAGYWRVKWWPIVKKRKLEYFDWYGKGPGSWEQHRGRLMKLLNKLQQQGLYSKDAAAAAARAEDAGSSSSSSEQKPLGILGLGWGNYIAFRAAGDEEFVAAGIQAVAAISPVTCMKDMDLSQNLRLPIAMLPAKYDPMEQMMLTIDLLQRPYAQRCIFKRYGKLKPGWAHWLPQWQDNRAMYQAAEQLLMAVAYLKRELLGVPSDILPPPLRQGEAAAAAAAAADAEAQQQQESVSDGEQEGEATDEATVAAARDMQQQRQQEEEKQ